MRKIYDDWQIEHILKLMEQRSLLSQMAESKVKTLILSVNI